jgi:hypothetical protein
VTGPATKIQVTNRAFMKKPEKTWPVLWKKKVETSRAREKIGRTVELIVRTAFNVISLGVSSLFPAPSLSSGTDERREDISPCR